MLLTMRAGSYVTRNLSPILDEMRAMKSPAEIAVIDKATRIGGEAIMEAMRSTAPGVAEHELDALARFIYVRHGAQGEAYRAIVASGGNAWFAHHRASDNVMAAGELVLMDYCPDLHYYRCDVTRQWPVNGTFTPVQRELYTFYLGVYEAILYSIKPHATAQAILQDAVRKMDVMLATMKFSKPLYRRRRRSSSTGIGVARRPQLAAAPISDMPLVCPPTTWAVGLASCVRGSSSRSSRSFGFRRSGFFSGSRT